jgi:hypothetical protein
MVATYIASHLNNLSEIRMLDYDIDGALNVVDLGQPQGAGNKCLPIAVFRRFRAGLFRSVSAPASVDAFQIIAATTADGTGSPTIVVAHAIGTAPDAVGDTIWLEVDVEQVREVLLTATHVGVRVDLANAADECVIFFERADPLYGPRQGLTADFIS